MNNTEISLFANDIRRNVVYAIGKKGGGHIGGSLSICDLIAVLYGDVMKYDSKNPDWEERDYIVCSKGHAAPALYSALALKGFFPPEWLDELNRPGTNLPGHSDRKVPGIDATTGSLGQGLSIACGIAHGLKVQGRGQNVFCITGDGENDEGQIWEAAAYAANYNLDNLIMFLDWNKKQIDGRNEEVMQLGDLVMKYHAFGWNSRKVNGHDIEEIRQNIYKALEVKNGRPTMLLLDTVKGAGISCIEKIENNHCIGLPENLMKECLDELSFIRERLDKEICN
ncbi:MAG: transketolase [Lachnospiraceae bacterium]|nr:transketolase [Lachnospiraceae bacterium]